VIAVDLFSMGGQDVTKVIGNQAVLFTFFLATFGALAVIPYSKRRPKEKKASWGECMLASMYVFGLMVVAFGICPDRWLAHSDAELGWGTTNIVYGPWDILKPTALGGAWMPITIPYQAIRDIGVVLIHVWFFGLLIYLWGKWQKRGSVVPSTAVATSNYGRPLVKKA
jgi:formate hydrogenlyase subunit 3/multisubunit Na+/H+ antiporter MnhD subunit